MKDIHKNPIFYCVLVPVLLALWPLLTWTVYLPKAQRSWQSEKAQYDQAQEIMTEILSLDPGRLDFADAKASTNEFDYANVVERIANLCAIPSTNYKLSSGIIITSGGQKSQSAKVGLKQVGIIKLAKFLSTIQLRWSNLQCEQLKLTKKKGFEDMWDVDLSFKYYY